MSQPSDPEITDVDNGPSVGPEKAPDDVDTGPSPDDGPQDVDQSLNFEVCESDDNEEDDDPEVHEVA